MKRASFWSLLALAAVLAGCGGSSQTTLPSARTGPLQSNADANAVTTSHWKMYRIPSTFYNQQVYAWPQRDGAILAFSFTCCGANSGNPPQGGIEGITLSGALVNNPPNTNPPGGAGVTGITTAIPMPVFPCAQNTQLCSISSYFVYGPSGAAYYIHNQGAPAAVEGAGNDVWFTVCCHQTYIVRGSNGSLHYFRTPNSLTDKTRAIARTADGSIWVTLQHANTTTWILARLNPTTSVVTEYPLQLPSSPAQLIVGADKNLWFALDKTLYRVEASNARVTRFALPQKSNGYLANGPNSTLWTPYVNSISDQGLMEVRTSGALVGAFTCPLSVCARDPLADTIQQLTEGPDGNIWFAYSYTNVNLFYRDDLYEGVGFYVP